MCVCKHSPSEAALRTHLTFPNPINVRILRDGVLVTARHVFSSIGVKVNMTNGLRHTQTCEVRQVKYLFEDRCIIVYILMLNWDIYDSKTTFWNFWKISPSSGFCLSNRFTQYLLTLPSVIMNQKWIVPTVGLKGSESVWITSTNLASEASRRTFSTVPWK